MLFLLPSFHRTTWHTSPSSSLFVPRLVRAIRLATCGCAQVTNVPAFFLMLLRSHFGVSVAFFSLCLQCSYRVFHWRNFVVIVLSRRPQRCFWFSFRDALMSSSLEILISQTEFPFTSGNLYFETHEMLPVICRVTRQTQLCG